MLVAATDQDGNPFKLVKVPVAETMYYPLTEDCAIYQWISRMEFLDGSSFPAPSDPVYELVPTSYMNCIVSKGIVIVPKYWREGIPDFVKKKDAWGQLCMRLSLADR